MTNAIREALAELVACKDAEDEIERRGDLPGGSGPGCNSDVYAELIADYARRQPLAWEAARTALASLEQASTPSAEAVAWFKHGPYEGDEPLVCVFDDPHDEDCYTPLYTHPPIPAPESAEPGWHVNEDGELPLFQHPESAKGAEQAAETFGWLIEMTGGPRPLWYTGGDILSADANEAVRFSTRERAIQVFGALRELRPRQSSLNLDYDCYTFTEHAWPRERVGASPSIKVKVRSSNQELSVVGWYGDTVFLASPPTQEGDGARERVSAAKENVALFLCPQHQGQSFSVSATVTSPPRVVCPICDPSVLASHQAGDRPERQE